MDTVIDVLHVVTAVFVVGPMAIIPMTAMRALRAGEGGLVRTLATSTFVFSLASLVVVVLGFGALGVSDPKYDLSITTPWIWISLLAYAVALVINLAVVVPTLRLAADRFAAPGGEKAAGDLYGRVAASSGIAALLLVVVVVLMVWKP